MSAQRRVSVIGLGYVGLPVAVAFGMKGRVIGFDIDAGRVAELRRGHDRTREVDGAELTASDVWFTSEPADLQDADFHIVAVPTPIDSAKQPDLGPLASASRTVGSQLKPGDIVVYESTVYPGATEEECVPILEHESNLVCGRDFKVGYSPERINPGDRAHRFTSIVKVVSGQDEETLEIVANVYASVVSAGVYRGASIKVAEAAKVIENTQRDLNIALMNELALIFDRMGIDTNDVLSAAATKWNFLPFTPGLVGGHCIGVDPYYLTHKSAMLNYYPQVILAGRRINDGMGPFVAQQAIKGIIQQGHSVRDCVVTVLGLTFKENVPDLRNSRVIDIVRELRGYGVNVQVQDPLVDVTEARDEYGIELIPDERLRKAHAIVLAVPHEAFTRTGWKGLEAKMLDGACVVVDVKGVLARDEVPCGVLLSRL